MILALAGGSAAALLALLAGAPLRAVGWGSIAALLGLLLAAAADLLHSVRAWRHAPVRMQRRLPAALAIGVRRVIPLWLELDAGKWRGTLYDHADPAMRTEGLPAPIRLHAGTRLELEYAVTPRRRGDLRFEPADLRLRSRAGMWELCVRAGERQVLRTYPDFAQVARYAWLAADRRLQEIGIKTWPRRGAGTDFKQLAEYHAGDAVRFIDWKATLRHSRPIVRQYQDERDQSVWLLIDCGRRMRAEDADGPVGSTHFDQVLNAVMLMSHVALHDGDAVGASTFGTAAGQSKYLAPRKGEMQLGRLMGALYDVQPAVNHSDYLRAAQDFLSRRPRRSLVVIITNFRDEDCAELTAALRLLRQRHLVLVASLRERVVGQLADQLPTLATAAEIASARLHLEARALALARLGGEHGLVVDAEPQRLGVELVNRYHAAKRSGML
jgi:uncharacterized protein (DUF58 family)